ncbi:MAG: hypothetical protein HS116_01735 [Planctomycetes bacterium]|nr:hypothetical protein [Planctomycetota bacterium]
MSDRGDDAPARGDASLDAAPEEFLQRLEPFERVLLDLKEQLYEGSWDRILADLRARLDGQPYIYKLGQTIARDIAAIEKMRAYERLHGVNLAERLKSSK